MQLLPISQLIPHPRNKEFFDDITGDAWDAFLDSISTSGVIEPVIITQDKLIISGHQRVRACKALRIPEVMTETRQYSDEDSILKDVLETNLRQRGIGNPNPVKLGRCIKELERIYGIRNGSFGKVILEDNNCPLKSEPKTEKEFAEKLGISVGSLKNYKRLGELIPEMEDFLLTGMITPTTALAIAQQLSSEDQVKLLSQLDSGRKYTGREISEEISSYKNRMEQLSEENARLKADKNEYIEKLRLKEEELKAYAKEAGDMSHSLYNSDELFKACSKCCEVRDVVLPKIENSGILREIDPSNVLYSTVEDALVSLIDVAKRILGKMKTIDIIDI